MGGHPCVGWWLHQAGEEPSSSWLLDNPSPSTGETSALTRMDTGLWPTPGFSQGDWVWIWMIFEVPSTPDHSVTLNHLSWVALGVLGVSCTLSASPALRGGSWAALGASTKESLESKRGKSREKRQEKNNPPPSGAG